MMEPYHHVWLTAHPHRTEEWLKERLRDGFDIHHLDGNHDNNDPLNLVLMDGADHMMLHNGKARMARLKIGGYRPRKAKTRAERIKALAKANWELDKLRAEEAADRYNPA